MASGAAVKVSPGCSITGLSSSADLDSRCFTDNRRESMSDSSELSQSDDLRVSDSDLNQHCSSCRKDSPDTACDFRIKWIL